jgi:hypothetical protein
MEGFRGRFERERLSTRQNTMLMRDRNKYLPNKQRTNIEVVQPYLYLINDGWTNLWKINKKNS